MVFQIYPQRVKFVFLCVFGSYFVLPYDILATSIEID